MILGQEMQVSYKRLFKLRIDQNIKSKDLCRVADISTATMAKLKKDGARTTSDVLVKICTALDCSFDDILEIVPCKNTVNNGSNFQNYD